MKNINIIIEQGEPGFYDAYSENCKGIYAAGESIEDVKKDVHEAIRLIKETLPPERQPEELKGEYTLTFKLDTQRGRIKNGVH